MKLAMLSLTASTAVLLLSAPSAQAGAVQVMLFGQPCQLQGPASVPESQLSAIHQISPEQTPLSENTKALQSSLDKLRAASNTPPALAHYVEQRSKSIEARLALENALQAARKARSPELFGSSLQKYLHPKRQKALVKQFEKALKAGNSPHAWDQIRADFAEVSESDGEEDFHRALRKLKVVYQCSFEDTQAGEGSHDAEEPAADEAVPPKPVPPAAAPAIKTKP